MNVAARKRRRGGSAAWRYARVMLREFRGTLIVAVVAVAAATALFAITPHASLGGHAPPFDLALYSAWMALFGEPVMGAPETWYLAIVDGFYPLLGFAIVGEGVVHFGMLMVSRRRGEKEWMRVMASTYRDHVILCGIGRLGFRVLEQLLAQGQDVVVVEKDASARFLGLARATGVPVLVRDMTEDQALVEAGVAEARAVVLATNDDMANLEAAMDSRRLNPRIRVVLRMYEQSLAGKLSDVFGVDAAFSASALAAPVVASMTLGTRVLSTCTIAGVTHVAAEVKIVSGALLAGARVADVEAARGVRLLALTSGTAGAAVQSPPAADASLAAGDVLVVHTPVARLAELAAAAGSAAPAPTSA